MKIHLRFADISMRRSFPLQSGQNHIADQSCRWLLTLEEFSSARLVGTEQQAENLRLIRESHAEMKKGAAIQLGKLVCIARKLA
jgi:hypothetical protein